MKQILACIVFIMFAISSANAQRIKLNLYSSYVFDDKFNSSYDPYTYYDGTIKGGYQWGAGLEFAPQPLYGVELLYLHQTTTAPTTYQNGGFTATHTDFDVNINYIMLGGRRYAPAAGGKVMGYGGLMAGVGIVDAKNPETGRNGSATKFAWGLRLGCDIWANARIGINLQAQLLSIVQAAGGSLYFGTGGAGAGLSAYSTMYQFGLGGGLTFKLGH